MSDNQEAYNPYNARNHESAAPVGKDDVMAVASLLGQVAGSLGEIDKNNLGGNSNFTAKKIDPKQALMNYAGSNLITKQSVSLPQPPSPESVATIPVIPPPVPVPMSHAVPADTRELENRIAALEKIVSTYKNIVKFKRGVSYNVTTSKISGTFKDVSTILDIITTELAKQTKSIIIKLNDNTKNKQ